MLGESNLSFEKIWLTAVTRVGAGTRGAMLLPTWFQHRKARGCEVRIGVVCSEFPFLVGIAGDRERACHCISNNSQEVGLLPPPLLPGVCSSSGTLSPERGCGVPTVVEKATSSSLLSAAVQSLVPLFWPGQASECVNPLGTRTVPHQACSAPEPNKENTNTHLVPSSFFPSPSRISR